LISDKYKGMDYKTTTKFLIFFEEDFKEEAENNIRICPDKIVKWIRGLVSKRDEEKFNNYKNAIMERKRRVIK